MRPISLVAERIKRGLPLAERPAPVGEQCAFEHGGYRLAYEVHGPADGSPMVLIHGLLLDAAINRDLAQVFARCGYRVVLPDLLGHGRSDKPTHAKELRIDFFAEHIEALMDHLGIERAIVGGVSLGAITTLQFAVRAPQRLRALFLEMPVMERATPAAALMLVPLMGAVYYAATPYRWLAQGLRRLPRPANNAARSVLDALSNEPETIAAVLHGILVGPVVPPRRERCRIDVPALVIGHGGDWLHNLEDAQILARELPNAQLMVAESVLELRLRPQRLLPEILRFFDQLVEAPAAATG